MTQSAESSTRPGSCGYFHSGICEGDEHVMHFPRSGRICLASVRHNLDQLSFPSDLEQCVPNQREVERVADHSDLSRRSANHVPPHVHSVFGADEGSERCALVQFLLRKLSPYSVTLRGQALDLLTEGCAFFPISRSL